METPAGKRLLAGPPATAGTESLADHQARLGPLTRAARGPDLVAELEASGILGRGGAGFPVGRKWRAMAERRSGPAVILVNGAEGEPMSAKDRVLMRLRPHLVLDGAELAAEAIGAAEVVVYVGTEHGLARAAVGRAVAERRASLGSPIRLVAAPEGYVSGEATAAVNFVNTGAARPTASPPRPSERGVGGRPTLVQNVESLAYAALIARFGSDWYRTAGRGTTRGTALVTVGDGFGRHGVREVELGTTVGELGESVGVPPRRTRAVLLGGYFGTWVDGAAAASLPLCPAALTEAALTFGCGLSAFLPDEVCGVAATARIMGFMAAGSARQCGPCLFGLASIADATRRLADGAGSAADLANVERWAGLVKGRGACHHPDGAVQLLTSALEVFADEFAAHAGHGVCSARRCVTAA